MIRLTVPQISDEECAAVERVLRSGFLVQGEECEKFEHELATYIGCEETVLVSSGTAALHLSLIASGIGNGDAVIVPDFTFPATANVVELVGAKPLFADVHPNSYNINAQTIQNVIDNWDGSEKISAVIPVHEFGCPAPMTEIVKIAKKYHLKVIEDAACALGAEYDEKKVGTYGDAGCFSFHPRKVLTTGEGGAVACNHHETVIKLRALRNHGIRLDQSVGGFNMPGFNYRMTDFQAAMGRVQLIKFNAWIEQRRFIQKLYHEAMRDLPVRLPDTINGHSWQTYMICLPDEINRDDIIRKLLENDVETNFGAHCLHMQEYYQRTYPEDIKKLSGNTSEKLFNHGLALPLYQGMTEEDVMTVVRSLKKVLDSFKTLG